MMIFTRLKVCAQRLDKCNSVYSLLDIGCRTAELRSLVKNCNYYRGLDIVAGDDIIQSDLNEGINLPDRSFDAVVALDVLEHLDDPHMVLAEMKRVAKKSIVISLPNMYHWTFRLNFFLGKGVSGKYKFPITPIVDRHRWLLSYQEAKSFVEYNFSGLDIDEYRIFQERGKLTSWITMIERCLTGIWPNLFIYGIVYHIRYSND